jgi:hypothetical protein
MTSKLLQEKNYQENSLMGTKYTQYFKGIENTLNIRQPHSGSFNRKESHLRYLVSTKNVSFKNFSLDLY